MPILPSPEAPFGLLEPLHRHMIQDAQPITSSNWVPVLIVPLFPMAIMAFLLQYENTRIYRLPLGIVGLAIMGHSHVCYRFLEPWQRAWNIGIGTAMVALSGKYIDFALLRGPIVDPYRAKGRNRLLSTFDLPINNRWVGLEATDLNAYAFEKAPKASSNGHGTKGSVKVDGKIFPRHPERWLPYTLAHRTRLQASIRHLTLAVTHYLVVNTLIEFLHIVAPETIGNSSGVKGSVPKFILTHRLIVFPWLQAVPFKSLNIEPILAPVWLTETVTEAFIAIIAWQGLSWGYRMVAVVAIASGIYEVEAWEVDLFDQPWKADSILNMWGRRWHQIFRRSFLLASTVLLRLFHIPVTSATLLVTSFFCSGMLHALGELSTDPAPYTVPVFYFFLLSGVGGVFEALFRRVTGRRVRGFWGRIWMWTFLFITGKQACWAWCDSGVGGSTFSPSMPFLDRGLGPYFFKLFSAVIAEITPVPGRKIDM
ncbi:hypothetical protein BD324DRAFT_628280 [Kockovaella imperatae]|uniref:Wax synthase domain-containing protein n=1 Tax=Kockovaella imperatae TaxID=4999 RepID=A0A1Y1UEA1_9TREE|nr:hypothetical protein BD324DRAFT_628280 [Kockovaella imperatae]ORX36319.1 hypothetical protein BD324DRAFT_628280 [Kockovaella imperatae]